MSIQLCHVRCRSVYCRFHKKRNLQKLRFSNFVGLDFVSDPGEEPTETCYLDAEYKFSPGNFMTSSIRRHHPLRRWVNAETTGAEREFTHRVECFLYHFTVRRVSMR